jgi:hypothetical protein
MGWDPPVSIGKRERMTGGPQLGKIDNEINSNFKNNNLN